MKPYTTRSHWLLGAVILGASIALGSEATSPGSPEDLSTFASLDPGAAFATAALAAAATGTSSDGSDRLLFASDGDDYRGGRGLITLEGVSGLFLNPTSGTLPEGNLTLQHCVAILEKNGSTDYQHTTMASYGVTDWLEVGLLGRLNDRAHASTVGAGGPLVRARILKDDAEGLLPELSVGAFLREGSQTVVKRTVFVAASKRFDFAENAAGRKTLRLHGGFRYLWQEAAVNVANGAVAFGGLEVEFPYDLWLAGEISNHPAVFAHQPYSIGAQWRPTDVLGLSVAGVQTGGEDRISLYVGIGLNLAF